MTRVLVTGMSGVGKSSVVRTLRARGFSCIDMDEPGWSFRDEQGHQRWDLSRLKLAMMDLSRESLFVAGCSEDQSQLSAAFSVKILLSVPRDVMVDRILSRPENVYGKTPAEMDEIMQNLEEVEPLLRRSCTHEIVTTIPLPKVVDRILEIVETVSDPGGLRNQTAQPGATDNLDGA